MKIKLNVKGSKYLPEINMIKFSPILTLVGGVACIHQIYKVFYVLMARTGWRMLLVQGFSSLVAIAFIIVVISEHAASSQIPILDNKIDFYKRELDIERNKNKLLMAKMKANDIE